MIVFGVVYLVLSINHVNCLTFLQGTASLSLPYDFPVASSFYRLQVLDETTGHLTKERLNFHIIRSVAFPNEGKAGRGLFTVDEHTGSLMLSPHRKHSLSEYKGSTFALDIVTMPSDRPSGNTTHATVVITVTNDSFASPECRPRDQLCFSSDEIQYSLFETTPPGTVLGSIRPLPYSKLCPDVDVQYNLSFDALLSVSSTTGYLHTNGSLDYETATYHEWNASCEVTTSNGSDTFYSRIRLFVLDVDDNPPYVQDSTSMLQDVDVSQIIPGEPLPTQLTVLDADSAAVNVIAVNLSDPLGLFHLRDPVTFHGINGTQMLINTALVPKIPFHLPDPSYNVTVTFEDTSLIGDDEERRLTFYVRIHNRSHPAHQPFSPTEDIQVYASIFRHSSHHGRVVQPMEVKPHDGYFFRLSGEPDKGLPSTRIFGVTPATGIVYIRDEVSLARSSANRFKLQLSWRSKDKTDRRCNILLRVLDADDPRTVCGVEPGHHFQSCALHANAETCSSSCGRGALDGFCRWRSQSSATLISEYATCSPHHESCPDGVCDELEMMDPLICPQDCASNVRGEAVPGPSGRGVGKSAAPCTCATPNTCVCINFSPLLKRARRPASRSRVKSVEEPHTVLPLPMEYQDNEWTQCGAVCSSMIAVVSLIICGLVATAGFLICRHRLTKYKDQEFPNVTTPLNSLNQHTDRAAEDPNESKLEFPRDRLTLGETLGEGEFGRVVKAKARNIAGVPGVTTVAVKMLKENSSETERRDLITEMNFLKEISHPNVVRLLGACTDDAGPLYVIVEYAEHGSLITYLRKMRARYPEVRGDMKELLSFAWQIAKGMNYLAEIKVVHRDLAARNILVATGKVMKISDFGLSRDVYEGDTYLKATKGRVPVKWMALESLQSQLYTTKSDVWSYGILLWEIVTLGGCPYPGIPSERLYQLLKEGYRMPRPDDCPLQLYRIMTSCWKENPNERPHFKELVQKLDNLLNDSAHYLPLTDDNCQPFCKRPRGRVEEASLMQQLTFPKMSVVQIGPYENRHLLSPTEFNV